MPVITLTPQNSTVKDTMVDSATPTTGYGTDNRLLIQASASTITRSLLSFDLGRIPNDAIINSATLKLRKSSGPADTIAVHRVDGGWAESNTWNGKPAYYATPAATLVTTATNQVYDVDVKILVQEWINGVYPNNGFLLKYADESISHTGTTIDSSNHATTSYHPQLIIDYTIPSTGKKQVEYIGSGATVEATSGTSATLPLPAGLVPGDLMVAVIHSPGEPSLPVGWSAGALFNGNSQAKYRIAYRFYQSGDTDVTFTGLSGVILGRVSAFRNVKSFVGIYPREVSSTAYSPAAQTTVVDDSLFVIINTISGNPTLTNPKDYTEAYLASGTSVGRSLQILYQYMHDDRDQTTTEMTTTLSSSYYGGSTLMVLEPYTNSAPNTPPTNNPKGTSTSPAIVTTSTPTFDWSFSDADAGNTQGAYQVRVKKASDSSVVHDSGKQASSVSDYQVPAGIIQKNELYFWEVTTWDQGDLQSGWSSPEYFKLLESVVAGDSYTFTYTGAAQTWTVPANVNKVKLEVYGAAGGTYGGASVGTARSKGGYSAGELAVTPGQVLQINVGGLGGGTNGNSKTAGWNGGGTGGDGEFNSGGGGGGATDVRTGANTLNDRVIVAGGGGGGYTSNTVGGAGGGLTGGAGYGSATPPGGGTQAAGGTAGANTGYAAGSFGQGASCGWNGVADSGGGGGGGGWYGGGAGGHSTAGGGGSGYVDPTMENASTTSGGNTVNDAKAVITVMLTTNPPTVSTREPGTTDQINPEGATAAPLFTWTYGGAFTQTKYQIKIYQGDTLTHDTGIIASAVQQHQLGTGVLQPGIIFGWELIVTDQNGIEYPDKRLYFITNNPPEALVPISPADTYRTNLRPVFLATIGNDVENDGQKFVLQLADDSDFTVNLQEYSNASAQVGWEAAPPAGNYAPITGDGVTSSYEGGTIRYTMQTDLTEGKTLYWRMAGIDVSSGARGAWSPTRSIRVGNVLQVQRKLVLTGDALAERILINLISTVATDGTTPAKLKVEVTNNGLDDTPVWEDVTQAVLLGNYHTFSNMTKTAVEGAVAVVFTVEANDTLGPIEIPDFAYSFD